MWKILGKQTLSNSREKEKRYQEWRADSWQVGGSRVILRSCHRPSSTNLYTCSVLYTCPFTWPWRSRATVAPTAWFFPFRAFLLPTHTVLLYFPSTFLLLTKLHCEVTSYFPRVSYCCDLTPRAMWMGLVQEDKEATHIQFHISITITNGSWYNHWMEQLWKMTLEVKIPNFSVLSSCVHDIWLLNSMVPVGGGTVN